jgi:hypothetical protein
MTMEMSSDRKRCLETNKIQVLQNVLPSWRELRNKKLEESDIDFLKAMEAYFASLQDSSAEVTKLKNLAIHRQLLRDVTQFTDTNVVEDEIDMMDYLPEILR